MENHTAISTAEVLMTIFGGVITLIMLAGIPWAYVIGIKMAHIESKLSNGVLAELSRHSEQIDNLGQRTHVLETLLKQNPEHAGRAVERQQRDDKNRS